MRLVRLPVSTRERKTKRAEGNDNEGRQTTEVQSMILPYPNTAFKCKVCKTFEVQTYFPSHYNQNERQPIMTANLSCFFPNFPFGEKLWVIMIEQVGEDSAVGKGNGEVEDRDGREAGNDESNPPQHQIYFLAHRRIRLYVVWRGVFKNFTRSLFQKS